MRSLCLGATSFSLPILSPTNWPTCGCSAAMPCRTLAGSLHADAFNLGINLGRAAGQTIAHLHLHVIPRYEGDVPDPRGGVRWILPQRAEYWNE